MRRIPSAGLPVSRRLPLSLLLLVSLFALWSSRSYADDTLVLPAASGDPGATGVLATVTGTHDLPVHGLSLAITYENEMITCTGLSFFGTEVASASPGGVPEFASISIDDAATPFLGYITAGIVFELNPVAEAAIPASPTAPQDLVHLVFDVDALALPATYALEFASSLGTPPVDNIFSSAGTTIFPALTSGSFTVNNNFNLYFTDVQVPSGGFADMILYADHPLALQGFQASIAYDNTTLSVVEPVDFVDWYAGLDAETLLTPAGSTIEFFNPIVMAALPPPDDTIGWVGLSAILDFLPPFAGQEIPAGVGHSLVNVRVQTAVGLAEGTLLTLELQNLIGPSPLDNLLVVLDGASVLPNLTPGTIEILAAAGYRRGDANSDGITNIADAIFLVNYNFTGGPPPACMDAGDTNDDGVVNVADVIYVINYQFVGGPPPPLPGPDNCGADPTDDSLDCGFYAPACL